MFTMHKLFTKISSIIKKPKVIDYMIEEPELNVLHVPLIIGHFGGSIEELYTYRLRDGSAVKDTRRLTGGVDYNASMKNMNFPRAVYNFDKLVWYSIDVSDLIKTSLDTIILSSSSEIQYYRINKNHNADDSSGDLLYLKLSFDSDKKDNLKQLRNIFLKRISGENGGDNIFLRWLTIAEYDDFGDLKHYSRYVILK